MNKILDYIKTRNVLSIILIIFIVFIAYVIFKVTTDIYITIQFDELEPFENNMPIFYKGFKIGKTRAIKPGKDFKNTYIKAVITYNGIKLPKNTTAMVKKRHKKDSDKSMDYIELIYPESPSISYLKTGSLIYGKSSMNWDTILSQEAEKGMLDNISGGVNDLLKNFSDTSIALTSIFNIVGEILEENRPNLLATTKNLADTTKNLSDISQKMDTSISQEKLDTTTDSVAKTSKNIQDTSKNLKEVSESINNLMPYIDATVIDFNGTMSNINEMSEGILGTLKHRMGFMKLMVGKPMK